jgi:hypothetical protein
MQRVLIGLSLFFILSAYFSTAVSATDCDKARYYLGLADSARGESTGWSQQNTDTGDNLTATSAQVAYHFADQAGQYLDEDSCSGDLVMKWFGYEFLSTPLDNASQASESIKDIRGRRRDTTNSILRRISLR